MVAKLSQNFTSRCFYIDEAPESLIKELGVARRALFIADVAFESLLKDGDADEPTMLMTVRQALASETAITNSPHSTDDRFLKVGNKLILALTPETYARAGLECTKTRHGQYYAEYDLTASGKRMDRLNWALDTTLTQQYTFETSLNTRKISDSSFSVHKMPSLVPDADDEGFQDWANTLVEWCGLVAQKSPALSNKTLDPFLHGHYPDLELGHPVPFVSTHNGPLTPAQINEQWQALKPYSWSIAIVSGYENAPNAWNRPHCAGDEAGYILVRSQEEAYAFKLVGWNDL